MGSKAAVALFGHYVCTLPQIPKLGVKIRQDLQD